MLHARLVIRYWATVSGLAWKKEYFYRYDPRAIHDHRFECAKAPAVFAAPTHYRIRASDRGRHG